MEGGGAVTTWQQKKQQKQELVTDLQKWHFSIWQIKFHHLKNIFKGDNQHMNDEYCQSMMGL